MLSLKVLDRSRLGRTVGSEQYGAWSASNRAMRHAGLLPLQRIANNWV